jgi:hypothetical protein
MSLVPRISQTPPPFDDDNDINNTSSNNDEIDFDLNSVDISNENSFNQQPNLDDFQVKHEINMNKNEEFTNNANLNDKSSDFNQNSNVNTNENDDWANFGSFETAVEVPIDQTNETASNDDVWGDFNTTHNDDFAGYQSSIANKEPEKESFDLKIDNLMNKIISDFELNFKLNHQSNDLTILQDNSQTLWQQLIDINNSDCLKFTWKSSKVEQLFLNSLNITHTQKRIPSFNDVLQPLKIDDLTQNKQKINNNNLLSVQTEQQHVQQQNEISFKLDLDLSYFENNLIQNTETHTQQQKQPNRILIEKLLDDIYPNSNANNLIAISNVDP